MYWQTLESLYLLGIVTTQHISLLYWWLSSSRPGGESSDNVAATIGVMQALISVFFDDNDKLRCINAGRTRITFLLRPPLYYSCVSSWGESESVVSFPPNPFLQWKYVNSSDLLLWSKTRSHLEYLHLQILSIVTAAQLRRIFERRTNFDLRRLLNGTFRTGIAFI